LSSGRNALKHLKNLGIEIVRTTVNQTALIAEQSDNGDVTMPAEPNAAAPRNRACSNVIGDFHPTPEQIKSEIDIVLESQLSPALQAWVDRYADVGSRNPYLWNWCRRGVEVTTLSCVDPACRDELGDTKVLGVMLDVMIDDVADQGGNPEFLASLLDLPYSIRKPDFARFSRKQQDYARFTAEIWDEIQRRIGKCPRYDEFANLVR